MTSHGLIALEAIPSGNGPGTGLRYSITMDFTVRALEKLLEEAKTSENQTVRAYLVTDATEDDIKSIASRLADQFPTPECASA